MYIEALRAWANRMDEVNANLTKRKQELDDDCADLESLETIVKKLFAEEWVGYYGVENR